MEKYLMFVDCRKIQNDLENFFQLYCPTKIINYLYQQALRMVFVLAKKLCSIMCSKYRNANSETGILWNDKSLGINGLSKNYYIQKIRKILVSRTKN